MAIPASVIKGIHSMDRYERSTDIIEDSLHVSGFPSNLISKLLFVSVLHVQQTIYKALLVVNDLSNNNLQFEKKAIPRTISHLKYYSYPGLGEWFRDDFYFSQAVRVGDRIELSGQTGFESKGKISDSVSEQVAQAFANVDKALKDAGGKGWSQAYSVKTYHCPLDKESHEAIIREFKKWMPDHKPIWTEIGVAALGLPEMKIEIEVIAHDPNANAEK